MGLEGRNGRAEKAKAGWIIFISLPPTVESEVITSEFDCTPKANMASCLLHAHGLLPFCGPGAMTSLELWISQIRISGKRLKEARLG